MPDAHPLKAEEWEEIVSSLLRMRSFAEELGGVFNRFGGDRDERYLGAVGLVRELDRMLDILGYQNPAERTLQS